ncbi:MAG: SDR family oxidoreductase [Geminicoccaceae bacterium]
MSIPKIALVTGAARRLGRAMALTLAEDGYDVAIHCRTSTDEAQSTAAEITASGRRATVVEADLADEAATETVVARAQAALGPIGVLVNNASTFELDNLLTADRASWDKHIEVNLRAPVVLAQGFVRQLPAGAHGAIVNLLDQRIHNLTPNFLSYSAAKMGLWAVTQVLARELAPRIRVNAIGPGPTLAHPAMSDGRFAELVAALPLRRGPSPEDIAEALRFILRMEAMTGQMITLDGGQQLGWLTPKAPKGE